MAGDSMWDAWKKSFDTWEQATADLMAVWLKSPLFLEPSGALLSAAMKMKAASERAQTHWWASWGLPTKRDQERTLHLLHKLESRLNDLEERLEDGAGRG